MAKEVYFHTILFTFKEGVTLGEVAEIVDLGMTLGARCGGKKAGILFWKFGRNLDTRKDVMLVEYAIFKDEAAFERFRAHPAHTEFAEKCARVADWVVGDLKVRQPMLL